MSCSLLDSNLLFRYFENLACEITKNLDKDSSSSLSTAVLLFQRIPCFKYLDCVELAIKGDCQSFIALPCVQNIATILWLGKVDSEKLEITKDVDRYYSHNNKK